MRNILNERRIIKGGDAINITDVNSLLPTINVDISKQSATSSIADTDLFLLETSAGLIKKITGANLKNESDTNFWSRSGGFIKPLTQTDKLQLFSSITNDSDAGSTFSDILTFKNTTSNSALATFKYQINDNSTNSTSNAKFKMVHFDDNTNTTTDIYSVDTSSILTFSKRLTLTNGLKQGSFNYTMPSSSGTLALQSELDDIWTRSSTNIQQTNTNDTLTLDYQADATYKDTLLIKNTNSGTDILTYKYQIKDNGSLDAKLNFKVDYSRGGGTSLDIFDVTYDGFLQVKKRLDVANGFFANNGEEYNFLSTGGTLANTSFFSGTSPITYNSTTGAIGSSFTLASISATSPIAYNNTTGVISTTFTPTSTDNMSGKTFQDHTLFNRSLQVKNGDGGETNVSGSVRFFEASDNGSFFTDLHTGGTSHQLTANRNVFLPDATGTLVLDSTNIWETQGTNIITPSNTSLTAIDLPNNCSIRNDAQDTQFIKFMHTTSTNEVIQLASNQVSIENILMYSGNSAYYLRFTNGTLESTFTNIDLPLNSKIRSASDSSNYIAMDSGAVYVNTNIDIIEGGAIRNDSDPTNDFISFRNNHLFINYAITEIKQTGKIANGSNPNNDFIQFNNDELAINHNNITFKQGASIKNASNSLSGFSFESDKITFATPVKIVSEYVFPFPDCYPLEIEGYYPAPDTTGSALYYQNVPSLGGRAIAINGDVNMSIYAEYGLYVHTGTEIWVASDSRIKKDIKTFNDGLDLLRKLEVKSYKYIDGKGKNTKYNEIGFIAQEVREIYPKAITQNREYIPNVYKKITCIWTDFENKFKMKSVDLQDVANVDYKFFCWDNNDKNETKITVIGNSDNSFTFKKKWDNVFCIGNKVNDFNVLDKSQLFVINFSATKELDNIVKEQQETINTLKNEVELLKEFMNELITSKSFSEFKNKIS
tara:strand:+ start:807 stop:3620 length:2814 start_codon:yes stop_codon:yes gene_type:complete